MERNLEHGKEVETWIMKRNFEHWSLERGMELGTWNGSWNIELNLEHGRKLGM